MQIGIFQSIWKAHNFYNPGNTIFLSCVLTYREKLCPNAFKSCISRFCVSVHRSIDSSCTLPFSPYGKGISELHKLRTRNCIPLDGRNGAERRMLLSVLNECSLSSYVLHVKSLSTSRFVCGFRTARLCSNWTFCLLCTLRKLLANID